MSEELEKIICRHLLREELSMEEKKSLDKWFSEEQNSHRILGQMRLMLDPKFEKERSRIKAETWDQLMNNKQVTDRIKNMSTKHTPLKQFIRIAVVLILISLAGVFSTQLIKEENPVVYTEKLIEKVALPGQKITTVLPDGSRVKLNSGSKIIAPESFTGGSREVTLIGEAFFEVVRDETRPFHVNVEEGVKVFVLGTSFLVNASRVNQNVVAVKSGKVSVRKRTSNESIILTKDELVKVSESRTLSKERITNGDILFGWIDNKLVFGAAEFSEVVKTIDNWFGYEIEVRLDTSNFDEYTASLTNPSLKEVMESLSHSYKFKYEIDERNKKISIE